VGAHQPYLNSHLSGLGILELIDHLLKSSLEYFGKSSPSVEHTSPTNSHLSGLGILELH
ncbi:hypothetical protein J6590_072206, partial [Homalodisca vitripennis]